MPEEKQQERTGQAAPREDVDDLIFRADPGWLASDR